MLAATPDPADLDVTAGMIDRLWQLCATEAKLGPEFDLDAATGKGLGAHLRDVLAARGRASYESRAELEAAVLGLPVTVAVSRELWRRVGPFLGCHPWRDPSVIRPEPRSATATSGRRTFAALRLQPRAPLNLNTADWKVLAAAWTGLAARYAVDRTADELRSSFHDTPILHEVSLPAAVAESLARRLVAHRYDGVAGTVRPFRSASDLDAWLDGEVAAGTISATQGVLLRVMLHPDAQLVCFNPDEVTRRPFDKTDLIAPRTEACFSAMGRFSIEVLGRVNRGGFELARAQAHVEVEAYQVVVDTSYRDFERGELLADAAGAPTLAIHPGVSAAAPAALAASHPLAASSGPAFDGRIGLAPIDPPLDRPERFHSTALSPGDGDPPAVSAKHALARPLVGSSPVGSRLVDGGYSDHTDLGPAHIAFRKSAAGTRRYDEERGGIAFWYKPNWAMDGTDTRVHSVLDFNGVTDAFTCQLYYLGRSPDPVAPDPVGLSTRFPKLILMVWDSSNKREGKVEIPLVDDAGEPRIQAGEWMHVSITWDATKVVMAVRSRFEDPGAAPPLLVGDDSGSGGPITLLQPIRGGLLGLLYWVVDHSIVLPPLLGSGGSVLPGLPLPHPPIADGLLAKPMMVKMSTMRLGGPLKTRPLTLPAGKPPRYTSRPAPSNGTYANLCSLARPEAGDPPAAILQSLLTDPAALLIAHDADHAALERLYFQGRYYNGEDLVGAAGWPAFARFRSRTLDVAAGHELGTMSWRGALSPRNSLVVRMLREGPGGWEEVPDPADPAQPLSWYTPGTCAIARAVVDAGLPASWRFGPVRYQVHLVDTVPSDKPLVESPYLESVQITVMAPSEYREWSWSP